MDIYDYTTRGGKNVITNYIDKLSAKERLEIYDIRQELSIVLDKLLAGTGFTYKIEKGYIVLVPVPVKQEQTEATSKKIQGVIVDTNGVAFLHICKKQKGKAEKQEIEKALERAKRENLI